MSEATSLIAEAKQLIAEAEEKVKGFEHVEATQLRIVGNRLRLFLDQLATHHTTVETSDAGEDVEVDEPKRRGRPPKTTE